MDELDTASDDVRAAIEQLQNPDVARDTRAPGRETQQELPLEAEPEDKPDRARDELGRFAKEDKPSEPEQKTKTATRDAPALEQQQTAKRNAPARLSKEAKAVWDSVNPTIQAEWEKFEADTQKGVDKLKTEHQTALQRFQETEALWAPRRDQFRQFGFQSDGQALQHLLSFSDSYQRDPTGTVIHLANQPGVDRNRLLSMLANGASSQPEQQQFQPQQQFQQPVDVRAAIREEMSLANAASQVESFAADQSFPHFQLVRQSMADLLNSGQAQTLEEAYGKAVDAVPALKRLAELEATAKKVEEEAANRAKQVEAKKRASNASLSGAPHGSSPAKKSNGKDRSSENYFDDAVDDVRAVIAQLS